MGRAAHVQLGVEGDGARRATRVFAVARMALPDRKDKDDPVPVTQDALAL